MDWLPGVQLAIVMTVFKVTVIVGAALVVDRLLRHRATALVRHRMWTVTILLGLTIPFVGHVTPAWRILPLEWSRSETLRADVTPPVVDTSARPPSTTAEQGAMVVGVESGPGERPVNIVMPNGASTSDPLRSASVRVEATVSESGGWLQSLPPSLGWLSLGWLSLGPLWLGPVWLTLAAIWLLGSVVQTVGLVSALRRERRLTRTSTPASQPWQEQGRRIARQLGVRRSIRFGESVSVDTPVTGGALRPAVLIPRPARGWSTARREVVLAHELVHVQRLDALRLLGARLLSCLFWFHPLVHRAAARANEAREQACDEAVIGFGTRPSDYATHLLAIASSVSGPRPSTMLAMAQESQLERRLLVILDASRPTRSSILAIATVSLLLVAGVALAGAMPAVPAPPAVPRPPVSAVVSYAPGVAPTAPSAPVHRRTGSTPPQAPSPMSPSSIPDPPAPPRAAPVVPTVAAAVSAPTLPAVPVAPTLGSRWSDHEQTCDEPFDRGFEGTSWSRSRGEGKDGKTDRLLAIFKMRDDLNLCLLTSGDVELDNGRLVLSRGTHAVVRTSSGTRDIRLEMRADAGGNTIRTLTVDGQERTYDTMAEHWLAAAIEVVKARRAIGNIHGKVGSLRGAIGSIHGKEGSLRGAIGSIHGKQGSLRGRIGSIHGELGSQRGRIASRRGEIASLRGERHHADEQRRQRIDDRIDTIESEIVDLERRLEEREAEAEEQIAEIESEIAAIGRERIRELEAEIASLDTDGRVAEIEAQIVALDADRRIAALEAESEAKADQLEAVIRRLR